MKSHFEPAELRYSTIRVIARGTLQGFLIGLILSLIYSSISSGAIITSIVVESGESLLEVLHELSVDSVKDTLWTYLIFAWLGASFGVVPAVLLGSITGLANSTLVIFFSTGSKADSFKIGALIPSMVLTGLVFSTIDADSFTGGLFAWGVVFGFPCLIFLITSLVLTWRQSRSLSGVPRFERGSRVAMVVIKALLAFLLLFDIGFPIYLALPKTSFKTYLMRWKSPEIIESIPFGSDRVANEKCKPEGFLEFEGCPDYGLAVCSSSLSDYLGNSALDSVEVVIEESYKNFQTGYEIIRVGTWTGRIEINGLQKLLSLSDVVNRGGKNYNDRCKPLNLPETEIFISR